MQGCNWVEEGRDVNIAEIRRLEVARIPPSGQRKGNEGRVCSWRRQYKLGRSERWNANWAVTGRLMPVDVHIWVCCYRTLPVGAEVGRRFDSLLL